MANVKMAGDVKHRQQQLTEAVANCHTLYAEVQRLKSKLKASMEQLAMERRAEQEEDLQIQELENLLEFLNKTRPSAGSGFDQKSSPVGKTVAGAPGGPHQPPRPIIRPRVIKASSASIDSTSMPTSRKSRRASKATDTAAAAPKIDTVAFSQ